METQEKKKQAKLKVTCETCGFPKSDLKGTSLTSWIFGKSCHCASDDTEAATGQVDDITSAQDLTDINERYETLSILGSGGMGTVYRVRDKTLDKVFALKVLRPELADNKEAVVRFKQEISAAQNLSHPNLVSVYDWGLSTEGSPYFVMDYVEGKSLADIIKSEKNLGLQRCLDLLLQVSEALAHAHEHNIVHRDLKPSNILISLTDDGTEFVKVVDFGIAKILPPPGKDTVSLTKTAEIFGSPAYMSPEQCKGERVDKRTDIYSFGCVMFECLIGQPPFARENPVKTILAHIYDQPPSVRSKLVGYSAPDSVAAAVNHCLNKDPGDRYESVNELVKDLNLLRDGQPPIALTRVSKEKRRRQLKFLGFKYSPQILTVLSIAILILAITDLPWLLALAELQTPKGLQRHSRADLAMQLVAKANDYNKPYALLMAAEADLESGLLLRAREKAESAAALFKARKDLPDTLVAYRLLIAQRLREGSFAAARALTREVTELQFANLDPAPKKGLRLIGWFYLPSLPAQLLDSQLVNAQLLFSYGDEDGAIASLNEAIEAIGKSKPKNADEQIRRINIRKVSMLFKSERDKAAVGLLNQLLADVNASPKLTHDEFYDIGLEALKAGLKNEAQTVFKAMPVNEPYLNPKRELALALCAKFDGNNPETEAQFNRAAESLISNYYYYSRDSAIALQLASAAADTNGQQCIDAYFMDLIRACELSKKHEFPDLIDGERSSANQRLNTLNSAHINLLINYANALSLYGRPADADRMRMQAVKLIPTENYDKRQYQRLGEGYIFDQNYTKAQNLFRFDPRFDRSEPRYSDDLLDMACADALAGNLTAAKAKLIEITKKINGLSAANDRAIAYTALGNIALKQSDTPSAVKYYELSLAEFRTPMFGDGDLNVYNRIRLAQAKEMEGKTSEALAQFNDGILRADSPFLQQCAMRRYYELLARSGDVERAKQILGRANKLRKLSAASDTITQGVQDLSLRVQLNDFIFDPLFAPTIPER